VIVENERLVAGQISGVRVVCSTRQMPQPKTASKTRKVARKSDDGQFTTKEYAEKHKRTTEIETVKVTKPRKPPKKKS
jgi:hypothetical protein